MIFLAPSSSVSSGKPNLTPPIQEPSALFLQVLILQRKEPAPPGGVEEAKHALEAMETTRLQPLIQRTQTQLKQPGLSPEAEGNLHQQIIAWRKEYLDRIKRS